MRAALAAPTDTSAPPQPQAQAGDAPQGEMANLPPSADTVGAMQMGENTVSPGDIGNSVLGAGRDALQGMADTLRHLDPTIPSDADIKDLGVNPEEVHAASSLPEVPRADESKSGASLVNTGRDVGRFILGFMGAGALLKGAGVAEGLASRVAAGGLGDFLVTGAHDPRIVDFLSDFPALKGGFLEALADAGKDGSESGFWERKLEAAGEGVVSGAAMEGIIKVAGVLRKVIVAQKDGDVAGAKEIIEKAQPELQQAYEDTQKVTPKAEPAPPAESPLSSDHVEMPTDGTTFDHSNGSSPLPLSDTAKAEIAGKTKDGAYAHFDSLTPETQQEIKDFVGKHPELLPPPPAAPYEPTFKLDAGNREAFDKALDTSLAVPWATLKAEANGSSLESTLGNYLNYSKMTGPDDMKFALAKLTDEIAPKIDAAGGGSLQTFEHVSEMADWFGTKPDVLMATLGQLAGASEKGAAAVQAGKIMTQNLTVNILRLSNMVRAGLATDNDKAMLLHMKDVLGDLAGLTKNAQRGGARITASGRMPTGPGLSDADRAALQSELGNETTKFVSNLLGLADDSPKGVIKLLEPSFGQKAWGVLHEFWVNSVLSGIPTQVVNVAGNARNTLLYPGYRAIGGVLTGDMKTAALGAAQYAALKNHIFDSLEVARRAFMSNAPVLDVRAQQLEAKQGWIKAATFGADDNSIFGTGINWLGNAINTPSRFLTTTDEFFGQLNYRASVEARARMQAVQDGLSTKPSVEVMVNGEKQMISPADQYVRQQMSDAFNALNGSAYDADGNIINPAAMADSRRSKFTTPLKPDATWLGSQSIGEWIHQGAARNPFLQHFALPFTKVPVNLFREMVNESPLAPIRAQFLHDVQAGGEARADALGRVSMGSVFALGMGFLAADGFITGQGPGDPDRQRQWRADGNVPYSFRFPGIGENGKDLFLPYNKFDPMAGIVGVIADFAYISGHTDERTQNNLATTAVLSLANNLNQKGYLQSLTDIMAALKGSRDGDTGARSAYKLISSRLASYVPNIVTAFKTDDTLREVRGIFDGVMNKIPGVAANLPPMYDNLGEPMIMPQGWPWRAINPFALAQGKSGPARDEMNEWSEGPTATKFVMRHPTVDGKIDLRDYKNPETGQNAYDRWMQLIGSPIFNGKTTEQDMNDLVRSDGYKDLKKSGKIDPYYPDHPAAQLIRQQLEQHYKIAHDTMLNEPGFEDLRNALGQFKVNQKAIPRGAEMPANPTLDQLLKANQ